MVFPIAIERVDAVGKIAAIPCRSAQSLLHVGHQHIDAEVATGFLGLGGLGLSKRKRADEIGLR
jgi:hypothetical protein